MIKSGRLPHIHGMACSTIMREQSELMIRCLRSIEIALMTRITIGRQRSRGFVTRRTLHALMRADKRKGCLGMIEHRRRPGIIGMAGDTFMRELRR